ncbi:unnamed protein product [Peronospora belbahrii]|nr:unnamed protein product [Peronospora belbahrii]
MNLGREIRRFIDQSSAKSSRKLENVRRQLDAIGFPQICDWKRYQWKELLLAALIQYKKIKGDLLVPGKFVVPEGDDQWPRSTWGLKLGSHVNFLRYKRDSLIKYKIKDLDDIGFVWVVADYNWDMLVMPALRHYQEIYGHCNVPQNFVVGEGDENGSSDRWPQELIGYRLGATVNRIRAGSAYAAHVNCDRKKLRALGFYHHSRDHTWAKTILPAFETYHRIYGNCNIDTLFIVPEDEPWPPSTWGMRLGFIARNIRNRGDYFLQVAKDVEKLKKIGFVWNVVATKWENAVMPALNTYVHKYGNSEIPANFVVPCENPWPTPSHGLKLGELATSVSQRKQFIDFIEIDRIQLEALGFFWSPLGLDEINESDEFYL